MRPATWVEVDLLVAAFIAGIAGVGIATRSILAAIGPHPAVAQAVFLTIASVAGIGGLIVFSFLVARVEFLCRGYRVGFRDDRAYYEERDASGGGGRSRSTGFP